MANQLMRATWRGRLSALCRSQNLAAKALVGHGQTSKPLAPSVIQLIKEAKYSVQRPRTLSPMNCSEQQPLLDICVLLCHQRPVHKKLLQTLVGQVDEQLLQSIPWKVLETIDVQKPKLHLGTG
jgi:hypothetical protein